jgi:hypothetical protein
MHILVIPKKMADKRYPEMPSLKSVLCFERSMLLFTYQFSLCVAGETVVIIIKNNSVVLVRKRTILIERSPPVSEASANFSG